MRRQLLVGCIVLAASTMIANVAVSAHHAFAAEFDQNAPVVLDGKLVKMEWINPHAWLHVEVTDKQTGEVKTWMIEGGAPNNLLRRGFGRNSVPLGTMVHIEGYRAKERGALRANGHILENVATGEAFFLGSSGTGAPYDKNPGVDYDANGRPIRKK